MKFKDWLTLQEVGTGTSSVAIFSRPIGVGMIQREPVDMLGFRDEDEDHGDNDKEKKKSKKKSK